LPQRPGSFTTTGIGGSNPGSGGDGPAPSSGNLDRSCPSNPTPNFPHQLSSKNQKKKKKDNIEPEAKVVDGQIILRVVRDDMPFYIDETTARKKIYHAPNFGVALPENLDLGYVKSLSTKDRLEYLSNPDILPPECVWEYMQKLGQHLMDPTTRITVSTLGKNGATKGWDEPISGTVGEMMHFSPMTALDFIQE